MQFSSDFVLKGSSTVRYPSTFKLTCTLAKEVQLFPGLGFYSGIFVIYLQCPSKESMTARIIFYVIGLLYILSTATLVCDLASTILQSYSLVSKNSTFNLKNIVFISYAVWCAIASASNGNTDYVISPWVCPRHCSRLLWPDRPMYLGTHKSMCCPSHPLSIHLNLQRSTDVGSCGVKISVLWLSLHSWQSLI